MDTVRNIGLSLGADLCWPACYEAIMKQLDLRIEHGNETIRFEVDRVSIEPFDLKQETKYDLVIDRLTHWYHTSREWIKKAILLNGVYVFNNPWSLQSMEKHTSYCAMMRLGMPIPDTWMLPPKAYKPSPDLTPTLHRYAKLFDLAKPGESMGYPLYLKPYDGGGWRSVVRANSEQELRKAYEDSGTEVMHVQAGIHPHDCFVRCVGLGPQTRMIRYDPQEPLHDRYTMDIDFLPTDQVEHLRKVTLVINTFFGWEFNSCESLRRHDVWYPIDFANPCPDSQVTSLHFHFPWLLTAFIRWSVFCAATRRRMRLNLDWQPYFDIADSDRTAEEKLDAYAAIAEERLDTHRFEEFCQRHLRDLDEVVWEFFGTSTAKRAIREKTAAMYPDHEAELFTELFWGRIQDWREKQSVRTAHVS
ncbi:MAG: RimK family alpha-L-glutamate ligase [Myxococcota bacterium]